MQLLANWKTILAKAWSVRLIILAVILSGIEVMLPLLQPALEGTMPKGLFAALAGIASASALAARIIAQPKTIGDA